MMTHRYHRSAYEALELKESIRRVLVTAAAGFFLVVLIYKLFH